MDNIFGLEAADWETNHIGYLRMNDPGQNTHSLHGQEAIEDTFYRSPIMAPTQIRLSTPPNEGSGGDNQAVSVSSSFYPGSDTSISDTILRSSDSVLFYISVNSILSCCSTAFRDFLGASISEKRFRDVIVDIPESSAVLNIIVHAIYETSAAKHAPSFDDLETAVNRMPVYGIMPNEHIIPSTALYDLLLSHAPLCPIRVYSLAGHFGMDEMAVKASSHLLSYDLSEITDDLAVTMGAIYLRRLMCLHYNLKEALKTIILLPPRHHPALSDCNFTEQHKLSRAWALAASYLAWDSKPDMSISSMQSTFATLGNHLDCDRCKQMLRERIHEVGVTWLNVKRTT